MSTIAPPGQTGEAEVRRLRTLYQLVSTLSRVTSLDEVYDAAISSLLAATQANRASILMFDEAGVMRFKAWRDLSESYRTAVTGHTPWSKGSRDARPIVVSDVLTDSNLQDYAPVFAREGIRALAFIPLSLGDGVFGKFMLYYSEPHEFTSDELDLAQAIAAHIAIGIESHRAQSQVENILGSIRESFIALDRQWRFTYVNERVVQRTALSREQIIGKSIWDVFPESIGAFREGYSRCMEERVPVQFEAHYPIWNRESVPREYEVHAYPTNEGICAYILDITDRKRTEAALAENEKRFRAFVTTSSDVVYRMSPDWTEMRQLQGRNFVPDTEESSSGWIEKYIHPDDQALVREGIEKAIGSQSPFELEHRVIRLDSSTGWTFSRAVPLHDAQGGIVEWVGAARDITERKRADADRARLMAQSEQQRHLYDTILSNTPDLVYVFDLQHRFTYANKALLTMWGKPWEEAIGKNCLELGYEPWHAAMHDREIDHVLATKETVRGTVPFTGTHGKRMYDYIFVPVMSPAGEVVAIAGTTRDVTDQKNTEEELRRANRDLEQFAYSASHDLQEPIRSVSIYSELLAREAREKLEGRPLEYLDYLIAGAKRMEMLVRDLLAYTHTSLLEEPVEQVDAGECLRAALANLSSAISESATRISVDSLASVRVHATHLQQLFQNLVGNAIKYRRPEVQTEEAVSAHRRDGNWMFSVHDNGIGIKPEYQERIFGLFKRLHTNHEYAGTGIGLALCSRILEHYHGRIWVEWVPGTGSTFYFTLPA